MLWKADAKIDSRNPKYVPKSPEKKVNYDGVNVLWKFLSRPLTISPERWHFKLGTSSMTSHATGQGEEVHFLYDVPYNL